MAFQFFDKTGKAILRAQEHVNKLARVRVSAAEQTDLARDAHTEALRVEATLSDRNQDRIARGDDLLDGAVEAENVRKTALAFGERERYQGGIERQLKEAEHELAAATGQQKHAQGREVATKLGASARAFTDLVGEFREHLPDAMPLLLGASELMRAVVRDCEAFARGPVAAIQAAPVRTITDDDRERCANCRHKESNHGSRGCMDCDRSCRSYTASAPAAPSAKLAVVRFKESFRGGSVDGMRLLPAMTAGETASYEPLVANWLCDDLKVAERVAPVETAEPVAPEAA